MSGYDRLVLAFQDTKRGLSPSRTPRMSVGNAAAISAMRSWVIAPPAPPAPPAVAPAVAAPPPRRLQRPTPAAAAVARVAAVAAVAAAAAAAAAALRRRHRRLPRRGAVARTAAPPPPPPPPPPLADVGDAPGQERRRLAPAARRLEVVAVDGVGAAPACPATARSASFADDARRLAATPASARAARPRARARRGASARGHDGALHDGERQADGDAHRPKRGRRGSRDDDERLRRRARR